MYECLLLDLLDLVPLEHFDRPTPLTASLIHVLRHDRCMFSNLRLVSIQVGTGHHSFQASNPLPDVFYFPFQLRYPCYNLLLIHCTTPVHPCSWAATILSRHCRGEEIHCLIDPLDEFLVTLSENVSDTAVSLIASVRANLLHVILHLCLRHIAADARYHLELSV